MIVYYKLANILKERGMTWKDLTKSGISINVPTSLSQNRSVSVDTLDKICTYLKVQPSEIMEWVENEEVLREREILAQIEALKKELATIKK